MTPAAALELGPAGEGTGAISKSKGKPTGRGARWRMKALHLLFKSPVMGKPAPDCDKHALLGRREAPGGPSAEATPLLPLSCCQGVSRSPSRSPGTPHFHTHTNSPLQRRLVPALAQVFRPAAWNAPCPVPGSPTLAASPLSPARAHSRTRTLPTQVHRRDSTLIPLACPPTPRRWRVPSLSPDGPDGAALTAEAGGELHEVRIIPVHVSSSVPRPLRASPEARGPGPRHSPHRPSARAPESGHRRPAAGSAGWAGPPGRARNPPLGRSGHIARRSRRPRQLVPVSNHA